MPRLARWLLLGLVLLGGGPALSAAERTYVVRAGDTLSQVAERELGATARFTEIAELNQLQPPYPLRVGQELRLPPIDATDPLAVDLRRRIAERQATAEVATPPPWRDWLDTGLGSAIVLLLLAWAGLTVVDGCGLRLGAWAVERHLSGPAIFFIAPIIAGSAIGILIAALATWFACQPLVWPVWLVAGLIGLLHLGSAWLLIHRALQASRRLAAVLLGLLLLARQAALLGVSLLW